MVRLSESVFPSIEAQQKPSASDGPVSIIDPACGDGALLLPLFDEFVARAAPRTLDADSPSRRKLEIFSRHFFGVDIDRAAVEQLRQQFFERIAPTPDESQETADAIAANLRTGDALTGPDFSGGTTTPPESAAGPSSEPRSLDWAAAFPTVAAAGGFDLVISNPPYLREKHAKPMFDRIAQTPLGRKWREPRMDLWYYFLHRSLDLLRPGGQLTFIVNAYWTASHGARRLTERLRRETTFTDVVLLGDRPVFDGVSGRHLIFSLRNCLAPARCRIRDCSNGPLPTKNTPANNDEEEGRTRFVDQPDLYRDGAIHFDRPVRAGLSMKSTVELGTVFEVRQGIAENPPRLSRRHCEVLGEDFAPGEPVFVLSADDVERLAFTPEERTRLRPYYTSAALQRYDIPAEPEWWILYLTKQTAPDLNGLPNIRRHLERFRPILDRRRETRLGKVPWWQLHWPREERLFTQPRLLNAQMGHHPRFAWCERPTFVGFSTNVVAATGDSPFDLPSLCGILNSRIAGNWFERFAKKRGVNLEINGGLLRRFPLPPEEPALMTALADLTRRRLALSGTVTDQADTPQAASPGETVQAPKGTPRRKQARILRSAAVAACYADDFRLQFSGDVAIIDFGVTRTDSSGKRRFVVERRIALSKYNLKRFRGSLALSVQRHESAFGKLKITEPAGSAETEPARKIDTHYANFVRVSSTPEEIILDCGLNTNPSSKTTVTIQITDVVAILHTTAKRIHTAVDEAIKKYEREHGTIQLDLPALPHAVGQFVQKSDDPNVEIKELARIVETDSGLTTEVLKYVNSSFVGLRSKASSVLQALTLLGKRQAKMHIVTTATQSAVRAKKSKLINQNSFWNASLQKALFAKEIAILLKTDKDLAFAGALLQDYLLPVISNELFDDYLQLITKRDEQPDGICEFEQQRFQWNHAMAGASLARRWHLPDDLVCCILFHHFGLRILGHKELARTPVAAVALSSLLPDELKQEMKGLIQLAKLGEKWSAFDLESIAAKVDREQEDIGIGVRNDFPLSRRCRAVLETLSV
eukprot:g26739.t1